MKILVVNTVVKKIKGDTGGKIVSERNIKLLKKCFGENNIYQYNVSYYSSKLEGFLYSLIGCCGGITPKVIYDILNIINVTKFDYVFLNWSQLGLLAKYLVKKIKIITFFHNVEYVFMDLMLKNSSLYLKMANLLRKRLVFLSEKNAVALSDTIITLNNRDSDVLEKIYHRRADLCLPVSFDDKFNREKIERNNNCHDDNQILFVGSDFFGNTEGLFWFIEKCLDNINAELVVVGTKMEQYVDKYPAKKVVFVGYVEDVAEYYYRTDAVVLPIISGSGMKTKTCEALMYGKTIFGTPEAFMGYEALDLAKNEWLCHNAEDFITKINNYLYNKKTKINEYSRSIFLRYYSSSVAADILYKYFADKN
jgi:hypothetical protein